MISLNEIRNRAITFAHEWEREYSEDAEAKSFWDGFFDVFGVSRRRVASFEYQVKKQDGSQGFIDVLWKGVMLAEHKTRGRNLDKAFTQAKEYFPGLKDVELPRYVIVSDFEKIRLTDLETETEEEFLLKDLHTKVHLFDFISGYTSIIDYGKEEEVSIKAARLMADFHNEIEKTGYGGHELEVFLIRILFCLFADDTGIFEKGLFRNYIENRINKDGSDLGIHLGQIFYTLSTPPERRQSTIDEQLMKFPYINGGIFAENLPPVSLHVTAYLKLLRCCEFDWSGISASIFGSLFQGVMNEKQRRELGAHYTSEINIMKVIQSLFLDELYIEFDKAKFDQKKLTVFHYHLTTLTFLDPACGCGNFLVTAYRELRKLELEILKTLRKDQKMVLFGAEDISKININQFYGIEIEEFPTLVARTAMYLVDHQMNMELSKEFGQAYARIPLREPATILHADALTTDWEGVISKDKLSYILGNPPFVGARIMNKEQKENFLKVFDNTNGVGNLDFVTAWYEKASQYMVGKKIKTAFVSTNSICQGEQVGILWKRLKEKYGVVIHFAHQTFKWNNDAPGVAAVHCIIVGFATFDTPKKYLFEYETIKSEPKEKEVSHINAYLVGSDDVYIEKRSKPVINAPKMNYGSMPIEDGHLIFSDDEKKEIEKTEPEYIKFIKQYTGGYEFLNNELRWCLWMDGVDPSEIRGSKILIDRVQKSKEFRLSSDREATKLLAKTPYLFGEIRQPNSEYILVPKVSSESREYLPIGFYPPEIIASGSCLIIAEPNKYYFGVLQSKMHTVWLKYVGGRMKSDYQYSASTVYNNFPWPENISEDQKKKVENCAQKVLDTRLQFPNSSLADLYDPNTMPPELVKAHDDLDRAVDACYGRKFKDKEQRIEFLFELYKKYTQK